jgi:predicted sulfurtransferase
LKTNVFSDAFPLLDDLLKDFPKDQRILTFCTGGVRCVKVNAYLKQKLGFTNLGRLQKGIVGYERWKAEQETKELRGNGKQKQHLFPPEGTNSNNNNSKTSKDNEEEKKLESIWIGRNFAFDRSRHMDS